MNDEGKIQLEETLNESANVTASTASDGDLIDDSNALDESATDAIRGPTAEVLSIDEHDTSTDYQNHLITNQINNNHNNNNNTTTTTATATATTKSNDSDDAIVDENPSDVTEASAIATDTADQITSSSTSTTTTTAIAENGVGDDLVVEKPMVALNSSNNDAANAVGFPSHTQHTIHSQNILSFQRKIPFYASSIVQRTYKHIIHTT